MHQRVSDLSQHQRHVLPTVAHKASVIGTEGQALLDGIDLAIVGSGILVVLGPNGAGKSMLLRLLTGLVPLSQGQVSWNGHPVDGKKMHHVGFVFQKPILFRRSVIENITLTLRNAGLKRTDARERASQALADADLLHMAHVPARRLSGGEQQRVAIVRARVTDPEVLFLDEPTAHLDPASTALIEKMIHDAKARGTRIVHVTHDLGQARRLADDIVFLNKGKIIEQGPATAFFNRPTSSAGRAFVAGELVI